MNMLKKIGILLSTISIITLLTGCKNEPEISKTDYASKIKVSEEPTKGYIWEATKDGKSIYLVGTKHPSPKNVNFFNETLMKIIEKSDILGVEIDLTDSALLREAQTLLNKQYISKDGDIKERLSVEEFEKLKILLNDLDISYGDVKNFSDIGVNAIISSTTLQKIGFTGTTLDQALITKFKENNKQVVSLETPQIQADALSVAQDTIDLGKFLLEYDSTTYLQNQSEYQNKSYDAFASGNKTYPEEFIKEEVSKLEKKGKTAVYDEVTKSRNTNMVKKINEYIKEDKKYVIAVGYMHYFGDDNILQLLEKEGYTITDLVQ